MRCSRSLAIGRPPDSRTASRVARKVRPSSSWATSKPACKYAASLRSWLYGDAAGADPRAALGFRSELERIAVNPDGQPLNVDWSPELSFTDSTLVYASYSKGYKGGGYNALPFNDQSLEYGPETANTYEAGLKTRLLDSTLDVNLAAFLTDFDDLQVSVFDGSSFNIQNAASARSQGFEADFRWLSPFPGTSVRGNAGYTDAYYRRYPNGPAPATA